MSSLETSVESAGSAPGRISRVGMIPPADGGVSRNDPNAQLSLLCLDRILKPSKASLVRIKIKSQENQEQLLKRSFDLAVHVVESLSDADYERAKDYDRLSDLNTMDVADWKSRYEELLQEKREQGKEVSDLTASEQNASPETAATESDARAEHDGTDADAGAGGGDETGSAGDSAQEIRPSGEQTGGMYERYSIQTYQRRKESQFRGNLRKIAVQFVRKELEDLLNRGTESGSPIRDRKAAEHVPETDPENSSGSRYGDGENPVTGSEKSRLICKLLFKLCDQKKLASLLWETIANRNKDDTARTRCRNLVAFLQKGFQDNDIRKVFVWLFSRELRGREDEITPERIAALSSSLNRLFPPESDGDTLPSDMPRRFQFVSLLRCQQFFYILRRYLGNAGRDPSKAAGLVKSCCQAIMASAGLSRDDFLDLPLYWTNCQYYEELTQDLDGGKDKDKDKDKGLAATLSFRDVLTAVMLFLGGAAASPFFTREDLVASLWDTSNGEGIEPDCLFDLPFYKKRITEFKASVTRAQQGIRRPDHVYSRFLLNFYCVFLARGSSSPYIPTGHEFYPCLVKTYACHLLECIIRRVWGSAGEDVIRKVLEELVEQVFANPVVRVILELTPAMRLNLGSVHIMTQKSRRNAMILLWQDRGVVQSFTICLDLMAGGLKLLRSGESEPVYLRIIPEPGVAADSDSVTESVSVSVSETETGSAQDSEPGNGNEQSSEKEPETDPVTSPGPETAA